MPSPTASNASNSDAVAAAKLAETQARRKDASRKRAERKKKVRLQRELEKKQKEEEERAELVAFLRGWGLDPDDVVAHVGTDGFLFAVDEAVRRRERERVRAGERVERVVVVQEEGGNGGGWWAWLGEIFN